MAEWRLYRTVPDALRARSLHSRVRVVLSILLKPGVDALLELGALLVKVVFDVVLGGV